MNVQRKYTGLGFLAWLFKIIAWIALIASIAFAVWFWFQDYTVQVLGFGVYRIPNWLGSIFLPFGILTFIQFYVLGGLISLLIDVEYNTRANATVTQALIKSVENLRVREAAQPSSGPAVLTPTPPPPPPPPPTEPLAAPTPATQPSQPVASTESVPPPPPPPPEPEPEPAPSSGAEAPPSPEPPATDQASEEANPQGDAS